MIILFYAPAWDITELAPLIAEIVDSKRFAEFNEQSTIWKLGTSGQFELAELNGLYIIINDKPDDEWILKTRYNIEQALGEIELVPPQDTEKSGINFHD